MGGYAQMQRLQYNVIGDNYLLSVTIFLLCLPSLLRPQPIMFRLFIDAEKCAKRPIIWKPVPQHRWYEKRWWISRCQETYVPWKSVNPVVEVTTGTAVITQRTSYMGCIGCWSKASSYIPIWNIKGIKYTFFFAWKPDTRFFNTRWEHDLQGLISFKTTQFASC